MAYYVKRWVCKSCSKRLSWHQKMHSHGCCPHCGAISETSATICDTIEKSVLVTSTLERITNWIRSKLSSLNP